MSSRERRLLDKDIEIRKLQGELKHYKTSFFSCVFEKERTRKALGAAIRGLDQMTWGCDSSYAEHLLKEIKEITALEQKD